MEIARPDDVRRQNRRLVLAAIRRAGSVSRTDITARTRLSPSTVSAITASLISEGILTDTPLGEQPASRRGRPQVQLSLNSNAAMIAVVAVVFNRINVWLVDYTGQTILGAERRLETLAAGNGELVNIVAAMLAALLSSGEASSRKLMHVAMGVQGVTDAASSTMIWSPIVPERDIAFGAILEKRFAVPVSVANDCNMIVEALRWDDPEHYSEDFAAVLLSHGIGMGLYLKGQPFLGGRSSAAEFGHMVHQPDGALCRCGRRGCIEAYAGSYAIMRRAEEVADTVPPGADIDRDAFSHLADRARAAPGRERDAFREAGRAIGFGLRNLFTLLDPVPVALVGPGADVFDLMEGDIRSALSGATGLAGVPGLNIRCYPDEFPLVMQGCIMTSLLYLDDAVMAAGDNRETLLQQTG
ncbi:MAG: ROK family transcriptional regulator [Phyllobacterium sp.]